MSAPTPWSVFEDDLRPAELLLQVHRLFQHRQPDNFEQLLIDLKNIIRAEAHEIPILIWNELFLGLIRPRARYVQEDFREPTINLLLRPAVVFSCTATETYLAALLRKYLQRVIATKGWRFYPQNDGTLNKYFEGLHFEVGEVTRLLAEPHEAPLYITNKILGLSNFQYLGSKKGIHVVGVLLGLEKPWVNIAEHLEITDAENKKGLQEDFEGIFNRRNDIVHRADRVIDKDEQGTRQIRYSWAERAVTSVRNVCRTLNEMVTERWGH